MKYLFVSRMFFLLFVIVVPVSAQRNNTNRTTKNNVHSLPYMAGDKTISAGLGAGLWGIYGDTTIPPISVSLDKGYNDKISIGGVVGFAGSKYTILYANYDYTYIILGGRGLYHFYNKDKIDAYAGPIIGYNIAKVSVRVAGELGSIGEGYLWYGGVLGGRYYFKPNTAAFVELGYGASYLTVGVSKKI